MLTSKFPGVEIVPRGEISLLVGETPPSSPPRPTPLAGDEAPPATPRISGSLAVCGTPLSASNRSAPLPVNEVLLPAPSQSDSLAVGENPLSAPCKPALLPDSHASPSTSSMSDLLATGETQFSTPSRSDPPPTVEAPLPTYSGSASAALSNSISAQGNSILRPASVTPPTFLSRFASLSVGETQFSSPSRSGPPTVEAPHPTQRGSTSAAVSNSISAQGNSVLRPASVMSPTSLNRSVSLVVGETPLSTSVRPILSPAGEPAVPSAYRPISFLAHKTPSTIPAPLKGVGRDDTEPNHGKPAQPQEFKLNHEPTKAARKAATPTSIPRFPSTHPSPQSNLPLPSPSSFAPSPASEPMNREPANMVLPEQMEMDWEPTGLARSFPTGTTCPAPGLEGTTAVPSAPAALHLTSESPSFPATSPQGCNSYAGIPKVPRTSNSHTQGPPGAGDSNPRGPSSHRGMSIPTVSQGEFLDLMDLCEDEGVFVDLSRDGGGYVHWSGDEGVVLDQDIIEGSYEPMDIDYDRYILSYEARSGDEMDWEPISG